MRVTTSRSRNVVGTGSSGEEHLVVMYFALMT
jgi:hypothetical protein